MTDVVVPTDDVVVVAEVAVSVEVGFGALGVSMCPANTDIARDRLKNVTALIRRKVFIFVPLKRSKIFH
jgi:hypothetical protein